MPLTYAITRCLVGWLYQLGVMICLIGFHRFSYVFVFVLRSRRSRPRLRMRARMPRSGMHLQNDCVPSQGHSQLCIRHVKHLPMFCSFKVLALLLPLARVVWDVSSGLLVSRWVLGEIIVACVWTFSHALSIQGFWRCCSRRQESFGMSGLASWLVAGSTVRPFVAEVRFRNHSVFLNCCWGH